MRIREFEYTTEDYKTVVHVHNAVWPEKTLDKGELKRLDEERKPPYIRRRFLAENDEQVVGYGLFEHRHNMYHPQRFWMRLDVLPAHRRQGIGRKLYEHMLAIMKSDYGANELHANTTDGLDFSIQFLNRCGFQEFQRHWESRLETTNFDWTRFSGLDEQIAALGIEIRVLSDLIVSDRDALRKVYELHQTLNQDSPSPAERTKVDFEFWRQGYSAENPHFLPEANFVALYNSAYVGLSGLWGDPLSGKLYTGMTGVRRGYRRKGIATALKLRGIFFAQARGNLLLITHNKGENPMLQLNLNLGFSKHGAEILFVKKMVQ